MYNDIHLIYPMYPDILKICQVPLLDTMSAIQDGDQTILLIAHCSRSIKATNKYYTY